MSTINISPWHSIPVPVLLPILCDIIPWQCRDNISIRWQPFYRNSSYSATLYNCLQSIWGHPVHHHQRQLWMVGFSGVMLRNHLTPFTKPPSSCNRMAGPVLAVLVTYANKLTNSSLLPPVSPNYHSITNWRVPKAAPLIPTTTRVSNTDYR